MSGAETEPGRVLVAERYRLVRELGRGGMGVVWQAEDQLVHRMVAVKELRPPAGLTAHERDTFGQRALTEARSAARIQHPGAVTLHDVLPASGPDDTVYLIMELIQGQTLAELIASHGHLQDTMVAWFGMQLASVLQAAHRLGVVHRDIKPGNIMITADRSVKLTDFGIAHTMGHTRLTDSGIIGTQSYLAPELFDRAPITPAADVWSLGATLFAAAAGYGPFDRETSSECLRAILLDDLPAAPCSPPLRAAIAGMLQRDPARRVSITQAGASLEAAHQALTQAPRHGAPPPPVPAAARAPAGARAVAPAPAGGPPGPPAVPWHGAAAGRGPAGAGDAARRPAAGGRPGRRLAGIIAIVIASAAVLAAAGIVTAHLATSHSRPQPAAKVTATGTVGTLSHPGSGPVNSVAFSPSGAVLATGDENGATYLWDTATHRLTASLASPRGKAVTSVAFSPDGRIVATGHSDGTIYLWSVATDSRTATLTAPFQPASQVDSIAFSPGSPVLAAAYEGDALLWNVTTGKLSGALSGSALSDATSLITCVAFSHDGRTLAAGDGVGDTYLWNTAARRVTATLRPPGDRSDVQSVAFARNGTLVTSDDTGAYLWNTATHRAIARLHDPGGNSTGQVAISPGGRALAVAANFKAYLWNTASHRIAATMQLNDSSLDLNAVAFSADGSTLAVGDDNGNTGLWHITGGG